MSTAIKPATPTDLAYARLWINLNQARAALAGKDTPTNRAAVERALAAFDVAFDRRIRR